MSRSRQQSMIILFVLFIMILFIAPSCHMGGPLFIGPPGLIMAILFFGVFIALLSTALKATVKLGGLALTIVIIAFGVLFMTYIVSPIGAIGPGLIRKIVLSMGGPLLGILWILMIVWIYNDAEERGMNGALWALLVLVGNIIGLIVYLLIRNEAITSGVSAPATQVCPSCKKTIKAEYTYCPYCSSKVNAVCPSCEKPVETGWKACPRCGHALKEEG